MTEPNVDTDMEALRAWYKSVLDDVVQKMIKIQAVTGAAVEANPVWMVPHQILIAKVWGAAQKSQFIWTISGDGVVTDHVAGSMATTPQNAAKHFAMKWQMNAEQFLDLAKSRPMTEVTKANLKVQAEKLIKNAESLYDLTTQDDIWKKRSFEK